MNKICIFLLQSDQSKIAINELPPNTSYNVTITAFNSKNEFVNTSETKTFSTLKDNFMPGSVTNISVVEYKPVTNDGKNLDMFIKWSPAEGKI